MNTTLVVNPDESIMIGSNSIPESNDEQVEGTRIIIEDIHNVYVPYGLLLCILIDLIICMYILTYHKYYINSAILFVIINTTLYGIRTSKIWTIKLYCAYHGMSIVFLGLYTYVLHAIIYSIYHISCIYYSIKCIKAMKMLLSNNIVIEV